jgi:hypothetical protein
MQPVAAKEHAMTQIQLMNSVIATERRLAYEEERRQNHRSEPYVNYLAPAQPNHRQRTSILAWLFRRRTERQAPERLARSMNEAACEDCAS